MAARAIPLLLLLTTFTAEAQEGGSQMGLKGSAGITMFYGANGVVASNPLITGGLAFRHRLNPGGTLGTELLYETRRFTQTDTRGVSVSARFPYLVLPVYYCGGPGPAQWQAGLYGAWPLAPNQAADRYQLQAQSPELGLELGGSLGLPPTRHLRLRLELSTRLGLTPMLGAAGQFPAEPLRNATLNVGLAAFWKRADGPAHPHSSQLPPAPDTARPWQWGVQVSTVRAASAFAEDPAHYWPSAGLVAERYARKGRLSLGAGLGYEARQTPEATPQARPYLVLPLWLKLGRPAALVRPLLGAYGSLALGQLATAELFGRRAPIEARQNRYDIGGLLGAEASLLARPRWRLTLQASYRATPIPLFNGSTSRTSSGFTASLVAYSWAR